MLSLFFANHRSVYRCYTQRLMETDTSPAPKSTRSSRLQPRPGCCHFWLPHKQRHCSFPVSGENKFCAVHQENDDDSGADARVPCPINPKHSVRTDALSYHV